MSYIKVKQQPLQAKKNEIGYKLWHRYFRHYYRQYLRQYLRQYFRQYLKHYLRQYRSLPFHEWRRGRTRRPPGCMRPRGRRFPGSRSTRRSGRRPRCRSAWRTWTTTLPGPVESSAMDFSLWLFDRVFFALYVWLKPTFPCIHRLMWGLYTWWKTTLRGPIEASEMKFLLFCYWVFDHFELYKPKFVVNGKTAFHCLIYSYRFMCGHAHDERQHREAQSKRLKWI